MSTLLDRARLLFARLLFAAAVAAMVGETARRQSAALSWAGMTRTQRSRHRVAMDKRAATKARNVKRNKAHG